MLEKSFPWSNTHMSTSDQWQSHAFKNGRAFMNGLTGIKNGFGICQFRAECTGNVNIPSDKNLKDWGRANVGAVPWKLRFCEHISKWGFFPALVGGETDSWPSSTYFRYSLHIDGQQIHAHVVVNPRVRTHCIALDWVDGHTARREFILRIIRCVALHTGQHRNILASSADLYAHMLRRNYPFL